MQHYHAAPISLPQSALAVEQRSLDDPLLQTWMQKQAGNTPAAWPLETWTLDSLTAAAYYFNTDLQVARAQLQAAIAGVQTAAMKPNPTLGGAAGYESAQESPYLFGLGFALPIETAGKRSHRMALANHQVEAARIHVGEVAWSIRSQVRGTLLQYMVMERQAALLQQQEKVDAKTTALLQQQLQAGEVAWPAVNNARIQLDHTRIALRTAEGQRETDRTAVAAAIGVPASALEGKRLEWKDFDHPQPASTVDLVQMEHLALLNRLDVRRALALYEASQSQLQLEIARQYPDLVLGPGYNYEEGAHFLAFQPSLVLPIRNQNQGPIAQATAQRKAAADALIAVQQHALSACDQSLARYRAASTTLAEIDNTLLQLQTRQQTSARASLQAGETERLSLQGLQLQTVATQQMRLQALAAVQTAWSDLEDVLQRPLIDPTTPDFPTASAQSSTGRTASQR
jgi:outer membrane protein TolC